MNNGIRLMQTSKTLSRQNNILKSNINKSNEITAKMNAIKLKLGGAI